MQGNYLPISKPQPAVEGWLLLFCLLLIVVYPASVIYRMGTSTWPLLLRTHDLSHAILISIYAVVFLGVGAFSVAAGVRLWTLKPGAVRLANLYLRTFLCAHLGYFALWLLATRPHISLSLARMVEAHVAGTLPFFFLWTSYLEHSKRVKETYGSVSDTSKV